MKCDVTKLRVITVEPVIFLFMFAGGLSLPIMRAVVYRKVCLSHFNASLCDDVDNGSFAEQENLVQTEASHWYLADNLCFDVPSIVTSFFYGAVSDHFSRKVALLIPVIGQVLSGVTCLLNAICVEWPVGFILIGPLCSGLCGGWVVCCLSAFSLLSDVTSAESRTTRIAIGESMIYLAFALAQFSGGAIMDSTSDVVVLSIALVMYFLTVVYIIFFIRDPAKSKCKMAAEECRKASGGRCASGSFLFNPAWIKEALFVIFKTRPHGRRTNILTIMGIMILLHFANTPSWALGYLFLKRYPLSWTQTLYGYYLGFSGGLKGLCLLTIIPLLIHKFYVRETSLVMFGLVTTATSELLFGLTTATWMVFLVPLVAFLGGSQYTCMRSLLSNMVDKNELGQMFAVFGSIQSASGLLAVALYNTVYPLTLTTWAGTCFVIGASVAVIPLFFIGWLHHRLKNESSYSLVKDEEDSLSESTSSPAPSICGDDGEEMHAMLGKDHSCTANGLPPHAAESHVITDNEEEETLFSREDGDPSHMTRRIRGCPPHIYA